MIKEAADDMGLMSTLSLLRSQSCQAQIAGGGSFQPRICARSWPVLFRFASQIAMVA
jgi:hypothetical protein